MGQESNTTDGSKVKGGVSFRLKYTLEEDMLRNLQNEQRSETNVVLISREADVSVFIHGWTLLVNSSYWRGKKIPEMMGRGGETVTLEVRASADVLIAVVFALYLGTAIFEDKAQVVESIGNLLRTLNLEGFGQLTDPFQQNILAQRVEKYNEFRVRYMVGGETFLMSFEGEAKSLTPLKYLTFKDRIILGCTLCRILLQSRTQVEEHKEAGTCGSGTLQMFGNLTAIPTDLPARRFSLGSTNGSSPPPSPGTPKGFCCNLCYQILETPGDRLKHDAWCSAKSQGEKQIRGEKLRSAQECGICNVKFVTTLATNKGIFMHFGDQHGLKLREDYSFAFPAPAKCLQTRSKGQHVHHPTDSAGEFLTSVFNCKQQILSSRRGRPYTRSSTAPGPTARTRSQSKPR